MTVRQRRVLEYLRDHPDVHLGLLNTGGGMNAVLWFENSTLDFHRGGPDVPLRTFQRLYAEWWIGEATAIAGYMLRDTGRDALGAVS